MCKQAICRSPYNDSSTFKLVTCGSSRCHAPYCLPTMWSLHKHSNVIFYLNKERKGREHLKIAEFPSPLPYLHILECSASQEAKYLTLSITDI